jgi:MoaA/NifB/PqqE/SkfB family radical SAM enzyme
MELNVGVGLTNACDLTCAHCYRDPARVEQLTLEETVGICDDLPVRSLNLGTGENGLHPDYEAIVAALARRGVKLSLTSNGYTIDSSSDGTLRSFREVEVSIDFPTESRADAFRGRGNWRRVMADRGGARAGGDGHRLSVAMMNELSPSGGDRRHRLGVGAHYR